MLNSRTENKLSGTIGGSLFYHVSEVPPFISFFRYIVLFLCVCYVFLFSVSCCCCFMGFLCVQTSASLHLYLLFVSYVGLFFLFAYCVSFSVFLI